MRISRIMTLALIGAMASLIIPTATYLSTRFSPPLSNDEKAVLAFTPTPAGLTPKTWQMVNIICPITAPPEKTSKHSITSPRSGLLVRPVSTASSQPKISFILQGATNNMAIIDGVVVKEGSSFNGGRVSRIEQNRILVDGKKGKKWLIMD